MTKKIYLSPSDQDNNAYAYGKTTEAAQCRKIALACKAALERCGFQAKTNTKDGTDAMYERVDESNAWGADMHICIHSNAGGGKGTEIYISRTEGERLKAAKYVYDEITALSPYGSSRGIKKGGWYEIKHTNAMCVYIETDFHDNKTIAKWIVENTTEIGEAICRALCKFYGIAYISPKKVSNSNLDKKNTVKTVSVTFPILKKGSTGPAVTNLQRLLKQRSWKDADGKVLEITGKFDDKTEQAVRKFQKAKLGGADGIVGKNTWNAIINK